MTSKQRAYLKSLAMTTEPILQIGKSSLTPEFTQSAKEALEARELIKFTFFRTVEMICVEWQRSLQSVHVHRLFRLSEEKSFFIKKEKKRRKSSSLMSGV